MISILVYGRNDERGYGMHKRVALSLNAMASVIDEGTAEILFVDYNTSDHLPTLPELIWDTLTPTARRRTRVLRVRPALHRPYAEITPLPVLEPIARNIALRRSRPQNRWILSTNTDSIIVPPAGGSLVAAVKDLQKGHYVLPRFELPERIWESFDRLDPKGTIEGAVRWGRMARLDEAVRGEGAVYFDAPGDFQLVARSDLFMMDGFDEEMLQGWHVDHNLARRLELALGPATSLAGKLALYHCGHSRQATATHTHDRRENDVGRHVNRVMSPDIPHQRDRWGCPGVRIEEIDLTRASGSALRTAIETAMPPLAGASLSSAYNKLAYDNFAYDAGHVASHLLDLLSTYSTDAVVAFSGCRRDLLSALVKGLAALGFANRLLVADDFAARLDAATRPQIQTAPLADVVEAADVLLFEFGLVRDEGGTPRDALIGVEPTDQELEALERVAAAFRVAIDRERSARAFGDPGRLLIAINAIHNRYDATVAAALAHAPAPFTTRLRYGPALSAAVSHPTGASETAAPPTASMEDLAAARASLRLLAESPSAVEDNRLEIAAHGPVIKRMLDSGRLDEHLGAAKQLLAERLQTAMAPVQELAPLVHDEPAAPQPPAASGLATLASWDDADWLAQARRVSTSGPRGSVRRNGWIWERAQILSALGPRIPSGRSLRTLAVCEHPDILVTLLAADLGALQVGDVRALLGDEPPQLRVVTDFAPGGFVRSGSVEVVDLAPSLSGTYDLMVLPHSALFRATVPGASRILAKLLPHLGEGGLLVVSGEVAAIGTGRAGRPGFAAASEDCLARALSEAANLTLHGDARFKITPHDAALVGTAQELDEGRPVLGVRRDDDIYWPAVWMFEAAGTPASDLFDRLASRLTGLVLGDITPMMSLTERGRREGSAIVGLSGHGGGHIFFGPYLRLPAGAYKTTIDITEIAAHASDPGKLNAEVCVGSEIVVQHEVRAGWSRKGARHKLELLFEISPRAAEERQPFEVRLWSEGKSDAHISSVTLVSTN
jgi:hypothetical protein